VTLAGADREPDASGGSRRATYVRLGLGALVVLGVLALFQYALLGSARNARLVPRPQRYTELYFAPPAALPAQILVGSTLPLSFVIANHEGSARLYSWSALWEKAGGVEVLTSGTAHVADGQAVRVRSSAALGAISGVGVVVVKLAAPVQKIDFHLRVRAGTRVPPRRATGSRRALRAR